MWTGLGYGYGLGLLGTFAVHAFALTSVPASLYVGVSAAITGTSSANGSTVTVTVNGEAWGTAVISGGAWSVTSTPTEAMIGTGVAVVATIIGASASGTTDVSHAVAITTLEFELAMTFETTIAGTSSAEGATVTVTVGGETLGTGVVAGGAWSVTGTPTYLSVGVAVAVVASVSGVSDTQNVDVLGVDAASCVAYLDYRLGVAIRDAGGGNIYVTDWSSQEPATGPVASNANAAEQPYYGDGSGGLIYDGTNDNLIVSGLSTASQNHTIVFTTSVAVAGALARYLLDVQTGRLIIGRRPSATSTAFAVYDGGWHYVAALAGAISASVITLILDTSTSTMRLRVNGVEQTFDDDSYAGVAVGGSVALSSQYDTTASWMGRSEFGLFWWDRVLSAGDLLRAEQYAARLLP